MSDWLQSNCVQIIIHLERKATKFSCSFTSGSLSISCFWSHGPSCHFESLSSFIDSFIPLTMNSCLCQNFMASRVHYLILINLKWNDIFGTTFCHLKCFIIVSFCSCGMDEYLRVFEMSISKKVCQKLVFSITQRGAFLSFLDSFVCGIQTARPKQTCGNQWKDLYFLWHIFLTLCHGSGPK